MLHSSLQTARPCVLARLQLSTKPACWMLIKACLLDAELDAGLEPMFQCDLKSNASWVAADSQSVAICAMHRSTDSWVTSFSLLPQPSHSWGHFLPELRAGLAQLPGFPVHKLVAAQDGIVDKVGSLPHASQDSPVEVSSKAACNTLKSGETKAGRMTAVAHTHA